MKVLATYNIKGGVGKTATAVNLAYLSARTYDGLWREVKERFFVTGYLPLVWEGEAPAEPCFQGLSGSAGASPSRMGR